MSKYPDPIKDSEFQRVVQTFLRTPHKPSKATKGHKPGKAKNPVSATKQRIIGVKE